MEVIDLTGMEFGRWTVLEREAERGAARYRCQCACGNIKSVLAKSLKSGSSRSCGCLNREIVRATARDLTGQAFGRLRVLARTEADGKAHRHAKVLWRCRCDCGQECDVESQALLSGRRVHCGCQRRSGSNKRDITGQRFRMLTALHETDRRAEHGGSVIWRCRCDCGREVDISYNSLKYGKTVSCGCQRKKCNQRLHSYLTHVAGTSVEAIRNKKPRRDNSTGHTGIYFNSGRFKAQITFCGKTYHLGRFDHLEEAVQAREKAERLLHDAFVAHYDSWKARAEADAKWAEENPIRISVATGIGGLEVNLLPRMN